MVGGLRGRDLAVIYSKQSDLAGFKAVVVPFK